MFMQCCMIGISCINCTSNLPKGLVLQYEPERCISTIVQKQDKKTVNYISKSNNIYK